MGLGGGSVASGHGYGSRLLRQLPLEDQTKGKQEEAADFADRRSRQTEKNFQVQLKSPSVEALKKEDRKSRRGKQAVCPKKERDNLTLVVKMRLCGRDVAPFFGCQDLGWAGNDWRHVAR